MNKKGTIFRTQDLYLASFLMARELKLIKVEKAGSVATFVFENQEQIEEIVTSFYNNLELIGANKLICSIRDLKSLVHNL
jgi:hypothetical protein